MNPKLYDIKHYKEGSMIYLEGTKALNHVFIIQEGTAWKKKSLFESETNEVIRKGDTFGLVSCLTGQPYMEQVITLTNCTVIIVKKENIIPFFSQEKQIFLKLIKNYSNKLRQRDREIKQLRGIKKQKDEALILLEAARYYQAKDMEGHARYALAQYIQNTKDKARQEEIRQKYQIVLEDGLHFTPYDKELQLIKDEIVFLEYEEATNFYLIKSGKIKISHIYEDKEVILSILQEGDFFGEMALLNNTHRMASAIVYDDCTLLSLNKDNFFDSLSDVILEKIFLKIAQWLFHSYKRMVNLTLHNPLLRIYDYIDYLIKTNQGIRNGDIFTLYFSYDDLKRMTDLSDAVPGDLERFEKDENIRISMGEMVILSVEKFNLSLWRFRSLTVRAGS